MLSHHHAIVTDLSLLLEYAAEHAEVGLYRAGRR